MKSIKKLSIIIVLSFILLTPELSIGIDLSILGKTLNANYLVSLLGLIPLFLAFTNKSEFRISSIAKMFLISVLLLGLFSLIFTTDFSYTKNFLFLSKNSLRFILFYWVCLKLKLNEDPWDLISLSLIPFVLVTIVFQFYPNFARAYFEVTTYSKDFIESSLLYQRTSWIGHATWEYGVLFNVFYLWKVNYSSITRKNILISSLLLLGSVIYGRTWMVMLPLFLLVNILSFSKFKKAALFFILNFSIVVPLTYLLYSVLHSQSTYFAWAWEFFIRYFQNNQFHSLSTKALSAQNAAFVKEYVFDWWKFLFGEGRYTYLNADGIVKYYGDKDSGYIREVLCVGIVFSLSLYVSAIVFFIKSLNMKKDFVFALYLLVSLFILQIKGDIIYFFMGFCFLIELFANLVGTRNEIPN